jgi:alpha-tubulin suppressor-like RCC1 family protein
LGKNSATIEPYPKVNTLLESRRIISVACGPDSSAAVTDEGEVYLWGYFSSEGLCFPQDTPKLYSELSKQLLFVAKVQRGTLHNTFLVDSRRTELLRALCKYSKLEVPFKTGFVKNLLCNVPPHEIKHIQNRALRHIGAGDEHALCLVWRSG